MSHPPSIKKSPAPAVDKAFRVLEYMSRKRLGAGVSEIARAIGVGKGSCFKLLTSMAVHQAVIQDPRTTVWRLGPRLVELGTATRRGYSLREELRRLLQPLVDETGMTALIGQVLANHAGVVLIDRVLPARKAEVILMPIGEVFPLTAPVFGRSVLARFDDEQALAIASTAGGFRSAATRRGLVQKLAEIRAQGFACSVAEYEPGFHAVGCTIQTNGGEDGFVISMIGRAQQLPRHRMNSIGAQLRDQARSLEETPLVNV